MSAYSVFAVTLVLLLACGFHPAEAQARNDYRQYVQQWLQLSRMLGWEKVRHAFPKGWDPNNMNNLLSMSDKCAGMGGMDEPHKESCGMHLMVDVMKASNALNMKSV